LKGAQRNKTFLVKLTDKNVPMPHGCQEKGKIITIKEIPGFRGETEFREISQLASALTTTKCRHM